MSDERQQWSVCAAVAVNLAAQIALLAALALTGEWRVFRFLANCAAQLDALIVLGWWAWKLRQPVPAKRGR